jgi:segregation and condensation protein B
MYYNTLMPLDAQIESILFWKGEPMKVKKLAETLNVEVSAIEQALESLTTRLAGRGVGLVRLEDEVSLGTSSETAELIAKLTKEELVKDLGKAGLETLTIILYKGPVKRSDIDYIRGVNSQFILRNLLIRGLIERVINPSDERSFLYKPTFDLMSYLGVNSLKNLPDYDVSTKALEEHLATEINNETTE